MTDKPIKGAAGLESLEWDKFVESVDVPGLFCVPMVAPDGSTSFSTTASRTAITDGTITSSASIVSINVDNLSLVTITVRGTYAGVTFVLEASQDGSNFYPVQGVDSSVNGSVSSTITPGTSASKMYSVTLAGVTVFRVRATAYTSGTANISMVATSDPLSLNVTATLSTGTNSIGSINGVVAGTGATSLGKANDAVAGATDTGVSILAVRQDALSSITPSIGDYARPLVDSQGALWVRLSGTSAVSFTKTNITTATTSAIKNGPGILHGIVVNKAVASGTITIYDNTAAAGTIIATITYPSVLLNNQDSFLYDAQINTGITVVTSAAFDLTVLYQ